MPELKVDVKLGGPCHILTLCEYFAIIFILSHVTCYTRTVFPTLLACFYYFHSSGQMTTGLTSIANSNNMSLLLCSIQVCHLATIKIFLFHMMCHT
jgi:hypothetical protein